MKADAFDSDYLMSYDDFTRNGVTAVSLASLISLVALVALLAFRPPKPRVFHKTHLFGYVVSLLCANILQSIGTIINFEWISSGGVPESKNMLCQAQGGIKQAGNLASAFWALAIAVHLFHLLFRRKQSNNGSLVFALISGWTIVVFFVIIGPLLLQKTERSPYFTVSGAWCWISASYPIEQIFLEYFLEFIAVGGSLIVYTLILLRVRGNLYKDENGWHLKHYPPEESWQLAFGRDLLDTSMYKAATIMVWFPITSAALLLPVSISRLLELSNVDVPFGFTVFVTMLYNFGGLLNVFQLWRMEKHFPDLSTLPRFSTPRKQFRISAIISSREKAATPELLPTPYTVGRSDTAEKFVRQRDLMNQVAQIERMSLDSVNSNTNLLQPPTEAHVYSHRRSQTMSVDMTMPMMPTVPARSHQSSYSVTDSDSMYSSSTVPTLPEIDRQPAASHGQWSSDVGFELLDAVEGVHGAPVRQSRNQTVTFGGPRRWI